MAKDEQMEEIFKLANIYGCDMVELEKHEENRDVYVLGWSDGEIRYTGYPMYIIVTKDEVHVASHEETMELMGLPLEGPVLTEEDIREHNMMLFGYSDDGDEVGEKDD